MGLINFIEYLGPLENICDLHTRMDLLFSSVQIRFCMEMNVGFLGRQTRAMSEQEGRHWVIIFEFGWVYWMEIFIIFMADEDV